MLDAPNKLVNFAGLDVKATQKPDISQEDLARALNVSFATVNRWKNGKYKPIKMAQAAFNDFCAKHGISFDE